MAKTHTQTATWDNGSTPLSATTTISVDSEANESVALAANATTKENFEYYAAGIQDVWILFSGGVVGDTVVLTTYAEAQGSQGTALDTLTLYSGEPILWRRSGPCPLQKTTDVKSIRVVSALTTIGTLDLCIGIDG